ncbi:MAG: Gfo/Idh/MocA family oxidoreductase [Deltaproteobacteria bacterium]|nr:Gfo/Idh/MocA family oxidoreductase [Deltaproteobacteria bacterium]
MNTIPHICFWGYGAVARAHIKRLKKLFPAIRLSHASHNGPHTGLPSFASFAESALSPDVDIVFITTPHAYHSELGVLAARHGKHLIIEKPVTRTLFELDDLLKAVKEHGVRCTVAENYFYKPAYLEIKRIIEEGLIGTPMVLEMAQTKRPAITGWRTDAALMGGGALLEGGVHWIDALLTICGGNPTEVLAVKPDVPVQTNIPFEDTSLVLAKFSNGMIAKLTYSWRIPNRFFGLGLSKVYGSDGVITFESNGLFLSVYGKKKIKKIFAPFGFTGYRDMLKNFVDDYMSGHDWKPGMDRILMEMQLIDAAYRSMESGRFERLV